MTNTARVMLAASAIVCAALIGGFPVHKSTVLPAGARAEANDDVIFHEPAIAEGTAQKTSASGQADPKALIAAIAKEFPASDEFPYSLIHIGTTAYLVKDGKVMQTKKTEKNGGLCGKYAAVFMVASDAQMKELSEGEGSMWKLDGAGWKRIFGTSAGDWPCDQMRRIPHGLWKCLGVDACV